MERISRFGFELECEISTNKREDWEELGVAPGTDGSIHHCEKCAKKGLFVVEFRSNPYVDIAKFEPFLKRIEKMEKAGKYHYNESMGFHVHVSFTETDTDSIITPKTLYSPAFVKFFIARLKKELPDVYRTRGKNNFCSLANPNNGKTVLDRVLHGQRYQAVNFRALSSHRTIEFRIFPADSPKNLRKYLAFVRDTIKEFIDTDEGRIHYAVKDTLPRMTTKNVGSEFIRYKARANGLRAYAPARYEVIKHMANLAQLEFQKQRKQKNWYTPQERTILDRVKGKLVPTFVMNMVEVHGVHKDIPYILIKNKRKTTITKITTPNV